MNRIAIKDRAKSALRANYWLLVGIFIVVSIIGSVSVFLTYDFKNVDFSNAESVELFLKGQNSSGGVRAGMGLLNVLISYFVTNVLAVGAAKVSLKAYRGESFDFSDLFFGFTNGRYLRIVGAMALMSLFTGLGTLFCIVPGVIVGLGLSQVPYLLADSDTSSGIRIGAMDAIRYSWDMMRGRKGEYFVLELSFIGWSLLAVLTFGLVGTFYATPYMNITLAGWYHETDSALRYGAY